MERMVHSAPIAWRPAGGSVYVVGTAASPVGDDDVSIRVEVRPGACLSVRSVAASVAWSGRQSQYRIDVVVGDGARLDWSLEPTIATAGCDHRQEVRIRLLGSGQVAWREEILLGRTGEDPGRLQTRLDVTCGRRPVLRHSLTIDRRSGPVDPSASPAVLGTARAVGLFLVAGTPDPSAGAVEPRPEAAGTGWSYSRLDGPGALLQALGPDIETLRRRMSEPRVAPFHSGADRASLTSGGR